jgi:hypothetical protein
MVVLYVLDVPEFLPIVESVRDQNGCRVTKPQSNANEAGGLVRHIYGRIERRDCGIRA